MADDPVPVRLCCGQPHSGGSVACPDGLVMCCLCFTRVPVSGVYVDQEGQAWDLCGPCGTGEETTGARHG